MRQLYLLHTQNDFLAKVMRELVSAVPWGHYANDLLKISECAPRRYYLQSTARFGWSRNVLLNQISAY